MGSSDNPRAWAARLGERQRVRDDDAAQVVRAEHEAAERVLVETLARWPPLVEALGGLVAAYNSGAGRPVLSLVQDLESSAQAAVTIESSNEGHPFLSARLDGPFICVSARDGRGVSYRDEHRMVPERNDERTAAYLLQNWLERL